MTRHVRPMVFESRTTFPVSAACVVANGVRETLAALFQSTVELRLFEPTVPSKTGWLAILEGARLYRICGPRANAAIVLRPAACVALTSAAFGEDAGGTRPLSAVETTVLDRIVNAVAANFTAVCGVRPEGLVPEPVTSLDGWLTYVELSLERPFSASIGIALATHREPESAGGLRIEDLLDVELDVCVQTEGTIVPAGELAALEPGEIVPITISTGLTAVATVAGRALARGECGVRANRYALAIGLSPCTERGSGPES